MSLRTTSDRLDTTCVRNLESACLHQYFQHSVIAQSVVAAAVLLAIIVVIVISSVPLSMQDLSNQTGRCSHLQSH
jgi:hypothetical protein